MYMFPYNFNVLFRYFGFVPVFQFHFGKSRHPPSSMYRSNSRIPQSKSMHIMPSGHSVTDPSTFSYFITLSLEYPKAPRLIWILVQR